MRVVHLNTFAYTGGAAIACRRITTCLSDHSDLDISILTSSIDSEQLFSIPQKISYLRVGYEKWLLSKALRKMSDRFLFESGLTGVRIDRYHKVRNADILHLHWVNQGFISLKGLERLLFPGIPVVWTLHDMWPVTGGCSYSYTCDHFMNSCGNCPMLKRSSYEDLSHYIHKKKKTILQHARITFIAPSRWMAELTSRSSIGQKARIVHIPNPINTASFIPGDPLKARKKNGFPDDKKLILFGAYNLTDPRKGFLRLVDALKILKVKSPRLIGEIGLVLFGKTTERILKDIPVPVIHLGRINDEDQLIGVYQSCDLLVAPSEQDNLPNVIMEAMACGLPVVSFNVGGISDLVVHQENGWLAEYPDTDSIAEGIQEMLSDQKKIAEMKFNSRKRIEDNFSYARVAQQYLEVYKSAISGSTEDQR
jgi:glycosyltransferase involved in cell wall biosynthesis